MTTNANHPEPVYHVHELDHLAISQRCTDCAALAGEPCHTRRSGLPTLPHSIRVDRAIRDYYAHRRSA